MCIPTSPMSSPSTVKRSRAPVADHALAEAIERLTVTRSVSEIQELIGHETLDADDELERDRVESLRRLALAAELARRRQPGPHRPRGPARRWRSPRSCRFSASDASWIAQAAPLHDVGKLSHPRLDPAQTGTAQRSGVRADQEPHHDRQRNPRRQPFRAPALCRGGRAQPSRALGWHRLSPAPAGGRDPRQRSGGGRRRRLRRPHPSTALQGSVVARRRSRGDRPAGGQPFRPRRGRGRSAPLTTSRWSSWSPPERALTASPRRPRPESARSPMGADPRWRCRRP